MTPAEEATFCALWTEGLSLKDIGARLGIPPGTVSSRAAALRRQGVALDKRPQGGAYPSQRAKAQQGGGTGEGVSGPTPGMSPQTPGVSKGVSTWVSKPVSVEVLPSSSAPAGSPEMTPLLQEILQELRTLTRGLAGRVSDSTPPVSPSTPQVPHRVSERVFRGGPSACVRKPSAGISTCQSTSSPQRRRRLKPSACIPASWWPRSCGSGWRRRCKS
jgi:hypothetical protein